VWIEHDAATNAKLRKAPESYGDFNVLHEIAADSKGNLYTAETRSRRVQRFLAKS
jgi:hypothetical protein